MGRLSTTLQKPNVPASSETAFDDTNNRKMYKNTDIAFTYDHRLTVKSALPYESSLYSGEEGELVVVNPEENNCFERLNPTIVIDVIKNSTAANMKDFIKTDLNYKTYDDAKYMYELTNADNFINENLFVYEGNLQEHKNSVKYYVVRKGTTFIKLKLYSGCNEGAHFNDDEESEFYKIYSSLSIN